MQKLTYTLNEIEEVAQRLIASTPNKTLAFHGAMGAGKTTLIKAIVKALGGKDNVNSPTFGIVNEYYFETGELLGFHFDFYRLNNESEAFDMGLEEYLDQDVYIFMEWPEKITSLIPEEATHIYIEPIKKDLRAISW